MALLLVISEFMSRPVLGQKPTCGQRHATHRRILPSAEREYHDHRLHQPDFSDWLTMPPAMPARRLWRSEEHTSELQSLMRISYAVFCLNKKTNADSIQPAHHN